MEYISTSLILLYIFLISKESLIFFRKIKKTENKKTIYKKYRKK